MKTNYQFERRQRDLAKKKKQEEKRLRKLAGKAQPGEGDPATDSPEPQSIDAVTPVPGDK